jgi:hypothetical protein
VRLTPSVTEIISAETPARAKIRQWLNKSDALIAILKRYGDDASVKELAQQQVTLGDMLAAMGLDAKGRDKIRSFPHFI